MANKGCFALYRGDEFIDLGTIDYLSQKENIAQDTLRFYATKFYKDNVQKENSFVVIRIDENEEDYEEQQHKTN